MMEHIKNLLLGLIVIALVIAGLGGIIWLLLNQTFQIVMSIIIPVLVLLVAAYVIGGIIRESRQGNIK